VAVGIGFFISVWILPKITEVIKELSNLEIPWYTQWVINYGDFMSSYWWLIAVLMVVIVASLIYYIRTDDGKKAWDRILIQLPVFGDLARYVYYSRFSENFAMLISSGVSVVSALETTADVVNNDVYRNIFLRTADHVKAGGTISESFAKYEEIPPLVVNMTAVGEESGKISETFRQVAEFYNSEADNITQSLTSLIEPILIVVLGFFVGIIVVSVLLPIYNLTANFQ
jgi:type II secretory pathway component PulF